MTFAKILATVANVRKALLSAAAVAATVVATNGVPADAKQWAAEIAAVLAAFGITYVVPNKSKA